MNGSLSGLVMCDEIIGMIKQIGKGVSRLNREDFPALV